MLNKDFNDISSIIGHDATIQLSNRIGGKAFYVAHNPGEALLLAAGEQDALSICSRFGGEYITLPSPKSIESFQRNARVIGMIDRGLSTATISERTGLSVNWINKVKRNVGNK